MYIYIYNRGTRGQSIVCNPSAGETKRGSVLGGTIINQRKGPRRGLRAEGPGPQGHRGAPTGPGGPQGPGPQGPTTAQWAHKGPGGPTRGWPTRAQGSPQGPRGPTRAWPARAHGGPQGPRGGGTKAQGGPQGSGPQEPSPQGPRGAHKGPGRPGPEESLGRSIATSKFDHSNPKLLALSIGGDMTVFVGGNILAIPYLP